MAAMGSVGDAYDNAMAESFFATLERAHHQARARTTALQPPAAADSLSGKMDKAA
jgi:transposase InsO family protein